MGTGRVWDPSSKELTVSWGNRRISKALQLSVMRAVIKLGIQVVLPQRFIHFSFIHLFISQRQRSAKIEGWPLQT